MPVLAVCVSVSLIDVASAEQTAVSHWALMKIIKFDDQDNIELAERYLLANALSTHPTESTLKHLLVRLILCRFLQFCPFVSLFIGRLVRIDLITLDGSEMYVSRNVRTSIHKSIPDFNEIGL